MFFLYSGFLAGYPSDTLTCNKTMITIQLKTTKLVPFYDTNTQSLAVGDPFKLQQLPDTQNKQDRNQGPCDNVQ